MWPRGARRYKIHAVSTTTDVDSLRIVCLFQDHVWRNHGLLEEVISDRGTVFISGFSDALGKLLGMKLSPSTAYHPQTDGQTECVNQEIEQFLCLFVNHRQDDWSEWLPLAEFSYNNRIHAATRLTPFGHRTTPLPGYRAILRDASRGHQRICCQHGCSPGRGQSSIRKCCTGHAQYYD